MKMYRGDGKVGSSWTKGYARFERADTDAGSASRCWWIRCGRGPAARLQRGRNGLAGRSIVRYPAAELRSRGRRPRRCVIRGASVGRFWRCSSALAGGGVYAIDNSGPRAGLNRGYPRTPFKGREHSGPSLAAARALVRNPSASRWRGTAQQQRQGSPGKLSQPYARDSRGEPQRYRGVCGDRRPPGLVG